MKKAKEEQILNMNVYMGGLMFNRNGEIDKRKEGMFALEYDDNFLHLSRCNIDDFPKSILISLKTSIKPKYVDKVVINYPDNQKGFVSAIDGYFGRPALVTGITQLRPLDKENREILREKINLIDSLDVKGKLIKIISN